MFYPWVAKQRGGDDNVHSRRDEYTASGPVRGPCVEVGKGPGVNGMPGFAIDPSLFHVSICTIPQTWILVSFLFIVAARSFSRA